MHWKLVIALAMILPVQTLLGAEEKMTARLIAPISTETNQKGDRLTAQVVEPPELVGSILQGVIIESKNGGSIKGTSVLTFRFDALEQNGRMLPIRSTIESMTNSRGELNVDEEGRAIRHTNRVGAAVGTAALGALIGGLAGGAQGAAIGAGAGAAASLLFIKFAVKGPRIQLDANSRFVVRVQGADKR